MGRCWLPRQGVSFFPIGDNTVKLWDIESGQQKASLEHTERVTSVAFSPDGTLASGAANNTVKLWDVDTRDRIATLEGHMG